MKTNKFGYKIYTTCIYYGFKVIDSWKSLGKCSRMLRSVIVPKFVNIFWAYKVGEDVSSAGNFNVLQLYEK